MEKMQLVGKKCLERRVPVPVVEIRTLHTDLDRKIALLQKGMLHIRGFGEVFKHVEILLLETTTILPDGKTAAYD